MNHKWILSFSSKMGRYLLYFSYIGSSFCGSQQQVMAGNQLVRTVQGVIEKGFDQIKLIERSKLTVASRTDSGVHALANCLHFDATYSKEGMKSTREPDPKMFMFSLNSVFDRWNEPIRVWKTLRVPPQFNCRSDAVSREYLYRVAVLSPTCSQVGMLAPLTAVEVNRCLVYSGEFSESLFLQAAETFNGLHSFKSFTTVESLEDKGGNAVRPMAVRVLKSSSLLNEHWPFSVDGQIQFYDILFKSNSFFYHQIRRMIGCMFQIASKRVPLEVLEAILSGKEHSPHSNSAHPTPTVSPCGLYLRHIEYRPEDFVLPANSVPSDDFPANVLKQFTKR